MGIFIGKNPCNFRHRIFIVIDSFDPNESLIELQNVLRNKDTNSCSANRNYSICEISCFSDESKSKFCYANL